MSPDLFTLSDLQPEYFTYERLTPESLRNTVSQLFQHSQSPPGTRFVELHIDDFCAFTNMTKAEALEDLRDNPHAEPFCKEEWWHIRY